MRLLISHTLCLVGGFVAGLLLYRNNVAKLQAKESETRKLLDALKGK